MNGEVDSPNLQWKYWKMNFGQTLIQNQQKRRKALVQDQCRFSVFTIDFKQKLAEGHMQVCFFEELLERFSDPSPTSY